MFKQYVKGALIAASVATFFACGGENDPSTSTTAASQTVKCAGINSCKGHSDCAGAESACKGLNACAGKGYLNVSSAEECKDKGGEVIES